MGKVAIMTDSNSGITQMEGKELGITVLPMPFTIEGETFYEDINLTQKEFYSRLGEDADIATSQPEAGKLIDTWKYLLKDYEEVVHIPMSSGLSGSCQTAIVLSGDFDGKVQVVNNQRISVTQRQSILDAIELAKAGLSAADIRERLETAKFEASIYIMVDTLKYLKKGGRITPAAAAIGTILNLKPVLQIQGKKLDAFAKARSVKHAKRIMLDAIKKDIETRFNQAEKEGTLRLHMAYTGEPEIIQEFKTEAEAQFPGYDIFVAPLSLSVACHIGAGAIAIACSNALTAEIAQ